MSAAATDTRKRLLCAAQELVEEGGYGAAPVLAVAERAGVAAGTLYRYWPSKGELFAELFRAVCDRELAAMRAAGASAPRDSGVARCEAALATFAERALRNPRLAWALIAEPVDPLLDAERLVYRRAYARLLVDGLREAIDAGDIPDQDVELTAAALVGGCGEALVGPLSPVAGTTPQAELILSSLRAFVRRAVGAGV